VCPPSLVYDARTGGCVAFVPDTGHIGTGAVPPVGAGAVPQVAATCPAGSLSIGGLCQSLTSPGTAVAGTCPAATVYNMTTGNCDPAPSSWGTYAEVGLLGAGLLAAGWALRHHLRRTKR
jgi:hypothetical protein